MADFPDASPRPDPAWARLAALGWLGDQPMAFREALRACGEWQVRRRGAPLYMAGDPANGVYGLLEGALEIAAPASVDEMVTLHRAGPGFWIGDSGLLSAQPRLVSVLAARDSTVFHAPARDVRQMLERQPAWWRCFYDLSHRNVALSLALLTEALALPPTARLARRMAALVDAAGTIRVTHGELAALTGLTRGTVARVVADLVQRGAVEQRYGALHVRDAAMLRAAGTPGS